MEQPQSDLVMEEKVRKKAESRALMRDAQWIGTATLLVLAFSAIGDMVITPVMQWLWPSSQSQSVYYQAVLYLLSSPLCILPAFYIAACGANRSLKSLLPFHTVNGLNFFGCVLFGFWGILAGNILSDILLIFFPFAQENLNVLMGKSATNPYELLAELGYLCLIPAVIEELAFRGVALQMFRKYGDGFAVLLSAILFGLFHGNMVQIPFAMGLGVVAGYITLITKSLLPAMVLHFCNNAIACLYAYFFSEIYDIFGGYTTYCLYGSWLVLGGIGALILYLDRHRTFFETNQEYSGCLSVGNRVLTLFKAVMFDLAVIVYLAIAIILTYPVMK